MLQTHKQKRKERIPSHFLTTMCRLGRNSDIYSGSSVLSQQIVLVERLWTTGMKPVSGGSGSMNGQPHVRPDFIWTHLPPPARCCLTVCRRWSSPPAGCNCSGPLPWQCHASANKDKNCGKAHMWHFAAVWLKIQQMYEMVKQTHNSEDNSVDKGSRLMLYKAFSQRSTKLWWCF